MYFAKNSAIDPMGCIIIDDWKISFGEIQSGKWPVLKPYFEESLLFCQEWLNGKETFQLKTSGSTGTPKILQVQRSQMMSSAKATGDFFQVKPRQNLLCCLHTSMIAGKMMLVRSMEWNSSLYLREPSSNPLLDFPLNQTFDFVALVPLQLEFCLQTTESKKLLDQIKNLIIGGAPIAPSLREKTFLLAGNVYQTYGMTETVSHIALADLKVSGQLVYHTLPGVKIRQTSDSRLEIAAPMTNHSWLLTNDVVQMVSNSRFIWKGRADFTINSGGIKIHPEEIEGQTIELINKLFPGRRFAIGGKPDSQLGQKVVLIIEGIGINPSQAENLLPLLKEILPQYTDPKEIHFLDSFAETVSGKVNRGETLKKLFGE